MHKRIAVASLVVALLTPTAAHAFFLGARVGWAIPGGDLREGTDLSDQFDGQVPIWVDLGWSVADRVVVGVYGRFAPNVRDSSAIEDCDFPDTDCGGYGLGLGGQLAFRFGPRNAGPWIGAFGGFEALSFEEAFAGETADQAFRGWELGAQGGIDFAWGPLVLGPYASVSVGRFTVVDADLSDIGGPTTAIPDAANHTWIQIGLRAAFDL